MPELPEVETVARIVRPSVEGRRVRDVDVHWERTLGGMRARHFREAVKGARIASVWRRAKYIVLDLERRGRSAGHLFTHLRMTGRLRVEPRPNDGKKERDPYLRVAFHLDGGETLEFLDVRKFGRLSFARDPEDVLGGLGPEPLGEDFTSDWLHRALRARKRMLKPLLLDQTFVAGLGNIYVDEALFRARLHPQRRSDRLPRRSSTALHHEIRQTLSEAIEREGSSFDTFYRTPEGRPGSYQHQFRVYGREGRPCRSCGRPIRKLVVAQRGTHICRRCQPAPR